MSKQTSLLPDRETIPAEDWAVLKRRAENPERLEALTWAYLDGWRRAVRRMHEKALELRLPQPPEGDA